MDQDLVRPAVPTSGSRLLTLDVLRGIAILGILFMNINTMGGPIAAAHSALPSLIGWSTLDQIAWALREVFASGTARCLLQMLFGAGMVILTDRMSAGASRWSAVRRYYWRNFVLFLFGLFHVWALLWFGDVLHIYALSAMIAFPLRRLKPRWLLLLGSTFAIYSTVMSGLGVQRAIHGNAVVAAAAQHRAQGLKPTAEEKKEIKNLDEWHKTVGDSRVATKKELKERRSGFFAWAKSMNGEWTGRYKRWRTVLSMYWESICALLVGAALFKLGILQGERSRAFYLKLMAAAYALGLPARAIATYFYYRQDDTVSLAWALSEPARIAVTVGHLALICWLLTSLASRRLLTPFAAAGRTALSLYILQTILCVWAIYPPFALGLFGKQGWMALMLTALAIDVALLALANWWVDRFEIAPVEWVWRSIAAGQRLPFQRRHRQAGAAGQQQPARA